MTTIAPDRRTFLKTLGVTAAAGLGTLTIAPRASASDGVVLPTTYLQQPNFFYCGPTAVSIALSAKVQPPSLDTLAAELATTDAGTNFGAVSPVLTARLAEATYRDHWIEGTAGSAAETDLLWERAVTNVDTGYATVCNWWVVAGEYPNWGGNASDIFHFVTVDGYNADERTLRVADPAGSTLSGTLPSHHWLPVGQVATYCAGRGYFW